MGAMEERRRERPVLVEGHEHSQQRHVVEPDQQWLEDVLLVRVVLALRFDDVLVILVVFVDILLDEI